MIKPAPLLLVSYRFVWSKEAECVYFFSVTCQISKLYEQLFEKKKWSAIEPVFSGTVLLSGRFSKSSTCIEGSLKADHSNKTKSNLSMHFYPCLSPKSMLEINHCIKWRFSSFFIKPLFCETGQPVLNGHSATPHLIQIRLYSRFEKVLSRDTYVYGRTRSRPSHKYPVLIACLSVMWYKVRFVIVFAQYLTDIGITITPVKKRERHNNTIMVPLITWNSTLFEENFLNIIVIHWVFSVVTLVMK